MFFFFFSSRRRHTRFSRDWSSDVCSSDLTDSAGQVQATTSDSATVTVVVPVIRAQATAVPLHVLPGDAFNFTVSFFNVGSGVARSLWLNASVGANLAVVGDDAAMSGAAVLGPLSWRFDNVRVLAYVFK